jgi:A/G-specific adenine glycosylase
MTSWKKLIQWSAAEHQELPWRKRRSLYHTLVSEIMLQQTTVGTVINHFDDFIKLYPNIKKLAASTEEEICIAWKGLGYYRRARNLRKAAIDIRDKYKGRIPLLKEELLSISGIGEYTAAALMSIGDSQPALSVDANLERVLSRIFALKEKKGPKLQKYIRELFEAKEILANIEKLGPREVNEALMDLGRVYCQARKVQCELCPMKNSCLAFDSGEPLRFPVGGMEKKIAKSFNLDLLRVIVKKGDKVIAYQKAEKEWLAGQLEIPTFIVNSEDPTLKQYPLLDRGKVKLDLDGLKSF